MPYNLLWSIAESVLEQRHTALCLSSRDVVEKSDLNVPRGRDTGACSVITWTGCLHACRRMDGWKGGREGGREGEGGGKDKYTG